MKYLFLIIFIISLIIHLFGSFKKNQKLRNISKPFLLTSLLGFYCLSTSHISLWLVIALFLSWIGDLCLIGKGVKWFTVGGISFMIGHLFFILTYCGDIDFNKIGLGYIIPLALFFVATSSLAFKSLKNHLPKSLFYPMYFYLLINGMMNCFAIFRLISNINIYTITTTIGAILFYISDTTLFFVRFHKNSIFKTHFVVMLTYSIGELLIILGLI